MKISVLTLGSCLALSALAESNRGSHKAEKQLYDGGKWESYKKQYDVGHGYNKDKDEDRQRFGKNKPPVEGL
jgi:hypothetical protein